MPQNHIVDPYFLWEAIEEFTFEYDIYVVVNKQQIDDYGRRVTQYEHNTIFGSLQPTETRINRSKDGNTISKTYDFYCKSLYRINIGDVIKYKNNYLLVESVHEYDEYGVRSCSLKMIDLTAYRDLADYIKYLNGTKIV